MVGVSGWPQMLLATMFWWVFFFLMIRGKGPSFNIEMVNQVSRSRTSVLQDSPGRAAQSCSPSFPTVPVPARVAIL